MKLVIQRVKEAAVRVEGQEVAKIGKGLLILMGIEKADEASQAEDLAKKVAALRVFEKSQGKMNLSLQEIQGEVLVISQFTLAADLRKGNRPSFDPAEVPERARELIARFIDLLKTQGVRVQQGRFGARMEVSLVNDGPVTFLLP